MKNELNFQTTIFEETFEADSLTREKWVSEDRDGNNRKWFWGNEKYAKKTALKGFSGNVFISISQGHIEPDNLLISPTIDLPNVDKLLLSYQIGAYKEDLPFEHYAVYALSPDDNTFIENEKALFEETLTIADAKIAVTKTVDISNYAGKAIKICFRHYNDEQSKKLGNSDKQFALFLDSVKIIN